MDCWAVVEIPKGSYNKYELDQNGELVLEWVSPVPFVQNYGFIAETLCADGDAVDVIIASSHALPPRTKLQVRPIAVLHMIDDGEVDNKLVAVACADPSMKHAEKVDDIECLSEAYIEQFLTDMKNTLGAVATFNGWGNAQEAYALIEEARLLYAGN